MGPVNNNFGSTPNYLPFSFLLFSSLLLYLLLLVPFLIRMIWTVVIYLFISTVVGLELDINDKDSICAAGAAIVQGQWNYYDGFRYGGTIGKFTWPYYWWQAGEAFGGMLNYYSVCDPKNGTLRKLLFDGMYVQAGENFDYIPANESYVEGNDDHGIWGLTVMEAVERNFTNPEEHSWLELTQAVYNTMNARWDPGSCGGGLRWQIFQWNSGYDYKNTISNGCLFQISARLARYTNNDTYAETAEKVWDWITEVGYVTYDATIEGKGGGFVIYDGGTTGSNCTKLTKIRWSYNYGMFMAGCAYMYNYTGEEKWAERAEEILNAGHYFFEDDIMQETFCHPNKCNNDQRSFRGLWSRFLASTSVLVPQLESEIRPFIEASAKGQLPRALGGLMVSLVE